MAIFAPPLRQTLQEFQAVETRVIGDGSRVRVSGIGVGLGIWRPWTPTYTNLTLGAGVVIAEFVRIGDTVRARYGLVFASDTSIDGTDPGISMPVTPHADYTTNDSIGTARILDSGTADHPATVRIVSSKFNVQVHKVDATYAVATAISATVPMTFTTNDKITFQATYEAA